MFTWLRARAAAKRMFLRDRGPTERIPTINEKGVDVLRTSVHALCNTRLRIGIVTDHYDEYVGEPILYCWRCETPISPKAKEEKDGN